VHSVSLHRIFLTRLRPQAGLRRGMAGLHDYFKRVFDFFLILLNFTPLPAPDTNCNGRSSNEKGGEGGRLRRRERITSKIVSSSSIVVVAVVVHRNRNRRGIMIRQSHIIETLSNFAKSLSKVLISDECPKASMRISWSTKPAPLPLYVDKTESA